MQRHAAPAYAFFVQPAPVSCIHSLKLRAAGRDVELLRRLATLQDSGTDGLCSCTA